MRLFIISKRTLIFIFSILLILIAALTILLIYKGNVEVFKEEIYYKGLGEEKNVAFLCNVDWGNEHIQDMLDIFKENNVKISFFLTGRWADENPDMVKLIYENEHSIGNHGYNHIDYSKLSYEQNREEILKTHNSIKSIIGKDVHLFGPPSGAFNENTLKAAKDLNYKMIMWSVDTIDWRNDSTKDVIVNRVISKISGSDIVLMHPTAETVKALPEIINYLFQNGYKIGTIDDVIN